jgi:hypothetical protein
MKASRTMVAIVVFAMLVGGAGAIWVYRDYHQWLALGPGGLPYNFHGWMATTWMRRLKRDPLDTSHFAIGSPGDRSFLDQLPSREGPRPTVAVHPVPHRQLDQLPDAEMKQKIVGAFNALVSRRSEIVHYQLSFFEKRNQAVFLNQPEAGSADAKLSHGEIAHVHPSDGSMHMIFSPSDAKKVIEAGWGECHPLAGKMGLPDTYLLVYPPRNDQELAVTARLLDAAVGHIAMLK